MKKALWCTFRSILLVLALAIPLAGCSLLEYPFPPKTDESVKEKVLMLKSVDFRGADPHAILTFEDGSVVATSGILQLYKPKTKYRLTYNTKTGRVLSVVPMNSTS